jgi:hypothetical protein
MRFCRGINLKTPSYDPHRQLYAETQEMRGAHDILLQVAVYAPRESMRSETLREAFNEVDAK